MYISHFRYHKMAYAVSTSRLATKVQQKLVSNTISQQRMTNQIELSTHVRTMNQSMTISAKLENANHLLHSWHAPQNRIAGGTILQSLPGRRSSAEICYLFSDIRIAKSIKVAILIKTCSH